MWDVAPALRGALGHEAPDPRDRHFAHDIGGRGHCHWRPCLRCGARGHGREHVGGQDGAFRSLALDRRDILAELAREPARLGRGRRQARPARRARSRRHFLPLAADVGQHIRFLNAPARRGNSGPVEAMLGRDA